MENMEVYQLMDELYNKRKQTGRPAQSLIDEMPADQRKKDALRRMLQYLLEGTGGPTDPVEWRY